MTFQLTKNLTRLEYAILILQTQQIPAHHSVIHNKKNQLTLPSYSPVAWELATAVETIEQSHLAGE
jgi:hypothetical protein